MFSDIELKELSGEIYDENPSDPSTWMTLEELLEFYCPTEEDIQQKDSQ